MSIMSADVASTSFYVLGSVAFLAHLLSMLNSYLKIREMRIKERMKKRKLTTPMRAVKKKLSEASVRNPNRPIR